MELSLRTQIQPLSHPNAGFNVCHFKDTQHTPLAPAHFHIVISLKDKEFIVLCIITKQIQGQARHYEDISIDDHHFDSMMASMIPLDGSQFKFLNTGCIIDCNQAEYLSIDDLEKRIDTAHRFKFQIMAMDHVIDADLKGKILTGILKSPQVKEIIKQRIEQCYNEYL